MTKTEEVVFRSKEDALAVLDAMQTLLNAYEQVSLADFLELAGIPPVFADNKVGWVNLINIEAKPVKDGFVLSLPPAKAL